MATITIGYQPQLTVDELISMFKKRFGDRYGIDRTPFNPFCDILVKRSMWASVAVRLKQKPNKSVLLFSGGPSSVWAAWLHATLGISSDVDWKDLEAEVRQFIEETWGPG